MQRNIKTVGDVQMTFEMLKREDILFHPDTPFSDYVNIDTGEATYKAEQANKRDEMLQQCFEVCERESIDIYELAFGIFHRESAE